MGANVLKNPGKHQTNKQTKKAKIFFARSLTLYIFCLCFHWSVVLGVWAHITTFCILPDFVQSQRVSNQQTHWSVQQRTLPGFISSPLNDAELLPFVGIIQRKSVIPQALVCPLASVQFLLSLSFNRATRRWWSEDTSAPCLSRTSWRVLRNLFPMHMWSIWFSVCKSVIPKSLCVCFGVGRVSLLWPGRRW